MKHARTKLESDKAIIRSLVRQLGPISRVKIHELTNIRRSTISLLTRQLLNEQAICVAGAASNPLGRKQILLKTNDESGFLIAVDFDAESVTAAVTDLFPTLRHVVRQPTNLSDGKNGLLAQLVGCARLALQESGVPQEKIVGVGIGDPGSVDSRRGISVFSSTIKFWKNVPIQSVFEKEFSLPTFLGSNTRAKTMAERKFSGIEMPEDMIYVEYTRGIGAGIVTQGKILEGHHFNAGEFGHTRITENGPPCHCGSFGCLEAVAGAAAIESRIRAALSGGGSSSALSTAGGDIDKITSWMVFEAARAGDKLCGTIVEEVGRYLGLGLANLVNLLDPALIILDQHLDLAGPALLDQIVKTVRLQALQQSTEDLSFRFAKLGTDAGILGASLLVLESIFEIPSLRPPKFLVEAAESQLQTT